MADTCIGKLLSCAQVGKDSVWPREPVRDVMDDIQSEPMMEGARTGLYNSRDVHWRGEGGEQEHGLAEKYRNWGKVLQVSHPFVAAKLLMELARTYDHEANWRETWAPIRSTNRRAQQITVGEAGFALLRAAKNYGHVIRRSAGLAPCRKG